MVTQLRPIPRRVATGELSVPGRVVALVGAVTRDVGALIALCSGRRDYRGAPEVALLKDGRSLVDGDAEHAEQHSMHDEDVSI